MNAIKENSTQRNTESNSLQDFSKWMQEVTVGTLDVGDKTFDQLKEEAMRDRYPDFFTDSNQ